MHGSAAAVPWDWEWEGHWEVGASSRVGADVTSKLVEKPLRLALFHTKDHHGRYTTMLYTFGASPPFAVTAVSRVVPLQGGTRAFASGLAIAPGGGKLVITYGVADADARSLVVSFDYVRSLFDWCTHIRPEGTAPSPPPRAYSAAPAPGWTEWTIGDVGGALQSAAVAPRATVHTTVSAARDSMQESAEAAGVDNGDDAATVAALTLLFVVLIALVAGFLMAVWRNLLTEVPRVELRGLRLGADLGRNRPARPKATPRGPKNSAFDEETEGGGQPAAPATPGQTPGARGDRAAAELELAASYYYQ